jgi:hypothetical protein
MMFLKILVHPHKKCFGRVGIECIILGKPNLHVIVFLEVGQSHLNSIPSHVLSKKFTYVFKHEGPTLSLWDIGWVSFLPCSIITNLVMKNIWVTHIKLRVLKLVWFLDSSFVFFVISIISMFYFYKLNFFSPFKVFQQHINVSQYQFPSITSICLVSGDRPKGLKCNLKFQSAQVVKNTFTIKKISCYLPFTSFELLWQSLIKSTIKGIQ